MKIVFKDTTKGSIVATESSSQCKMWNRKPALMATTLTTSGTEITARKMSVVDLSIIDYILLDDGVTKYSVSAKYGVMSNAGLLTELNALLAVDVSNASVAAVYEEEAKAEASDPTKLTIKVFLNNGTTDYLTVSVDRSKFQYVTPKYVLKNLGDSIVYARHTFSGFATDDAGTDMIQNGDKFTTDTSIYCVWTVVPLADSTLDM